MPQRRAFVSSHPDAAMKEATFDMGKVADATQFVKSMETFVGFVGRSGRDHTDRLRLILNGGVDVLPTIAMPTRPTPEEIEADDLERSIYLEDRKIAMRKQDKLNLEVGQLYDELWEQCSAELKAKMRGENGFAAVETARDPLALRNRIKSVCCGFEAHKMKFYALSQAIKKLMMFYQKPGMHNEEYKRQFEALWDTVAQFGGSVTNHTDLIATRASEIATANNRQAPNEVDTETATSEVDEQMKACFMLGGASNEKFHPLKDHLENQYTMGVDQYPNNAESLLGMMNNFRMAPATGGKYRPLQRDGDDDGLVFAQEGDEECVEEEADVDGANMAQQGGARRAPPPQSKQDFKAPNYPHKTKKCYHCNTLGHIARDCPQLDQQGIGQIHAQFGYTLLQRDGVIKSSYLYLDTCTTNNYMCNPAYLTGIHSSKKSLRLQTNAGSTSTSKQGFLGSIRMWLGETGMANVISINSLEELCRKRGGNLSYHSEQTGGAFVANLGNGEVVTFKRCPHTDFPYIDLDDHCGDDGAVMLLQSVSKNMEGYTKTEVQRAINARDAQANMGYINEGDLKNEG